MSNRKQNKFKITKDVEEEDQSSTSEEAVQRRPRFNQKGKRSDKKSQRDEKRLEDFKGKQGERFVQEKLFFGFNNHIIEALKTIQVQQVSRTIIVPVSTRSAGFIIRNLMVKFIQLGVIDQDQAKVLASALYRVTLLQMDLKLEEAKLLQPSRNLDLHSFKDVYVNSDQRLALELMSANFSQLVNYISSLGYIKTAAKCYLPRHPRVNAQNRDFIHQRFGTLRSTVEYLSSADTPNEAKLAFMEHCPFPSATWNVQQQAMGGQPVVNLANPNEIMPANYGTQLLREDIALIATHVERIGRKYPKYICTEGIDWKGLGGLSLLVSNSTASIKCPSWPSNGKTVRSISGEHDDFWTAEILSDPEVFMGVAYMFGEIDSSVYVNRDCIAFRLKASACREISF